MATNRTGLEKIKNSTSDITPGAKPTRSAKLRTFSSLANPTFRLYFLGMFIQAAASNTSMMVRSLLVYRLTGSAAILGVVALVSTVPHIITSLYGGAIADRIPKKYIILFGLGIFGVMSLGVALSLTFGFLTAKTWWILAIDSIGFYSLIGLQIPARHAIIREVVGREQLMNAISLNSMGANTWMLIAPAAAGFLIDSFGFTAVYYVMAGIYGLSALFIAIMPRTSGPSHSHQSAWKATIDGLRYIRSEPNIMAILVFSMAFIVFAQPFQQIMPLFTDGIFKVGAKGLGVLRSVTGVGAIATGLILASLPNKKRGIMMVLGTLLTGLALVGFSFTKAWPLAIGTVFVLGIGQMARQALSNTLTQSFTTDEYRGRVMGVYDMQISFHLVGVWALGMMSEAFGAPWALGSFSIALVITCVATLFFSQRLRKME